MPLAARANEIQTLWQSGHMAANAADLKLFWDTPSGSGANRL